MPTTRLKTEAAIPWEAGNPRSVEEVELDDLRQGAVRVKLASRDLCHSDGHAVKQDLLVELPIIGGHKGAGVVDEVGPRVSRLEPGNHVALLFTPACGHCR